MLIRGAGAAEGATTEVYPLLGTHIVIEAWAVSRARADQVVEAALDEIARLHAVFTTFDENSPLCRWRSGSTDEAPAELVQVLALAEQWTARSDGAFRPDLGRVTEARRGVGPGALLPVVVPPSGPLPYTVRDGIVHRLGDCTGVDLNALVKGWIVDRALDAAAGLGGVSDALVNAGGDLAHRGPGRVSVRVEDPRHPVDNAAGLGVLEIGGAAVATSSNARRGVMSAAGWHGHVLDPRSGQSVQTTASATVLAPDAATADACATIGMVEPPDRALALIAPHAEALLVTASSDQFATVGWPGLRSG